MQLAMTLLGIGISLCVIIRYFWGDEETEFEKEHREALDAREKKGEGK